MGNCPTHHNFFYIYIYIYFISISDVSSCLSHEKSFCTCMVNGTVLNRSALSGEVLLMRTNNILFYGEIRENVCELSSNSLS